MAKSEAKTRQLTTFTDAPLNAKVTTGHQANVNTKLLAVASEEKVNRVFITDEAKKYHIRYTNNNI